VRFFAQSYVQISIFEDIFWQKSCWIFREPKGLKSMSAYWIWFVEENISIIYII